MSSLENKVALITGGARGQGRSHAVALARQGADVVLVDAPAPVASVSYGLGTESDLSDTVKLVEEQGRTALAVQGDVRKPADLRRAVTRAVEEFGHVDILLANAGITSYGKLSEMDDQQWQDMIDINLTGVANSIRAVLPHMLDRSYGRIVVTSSQAARRGMPNLAHYCAAKWGLIGLVKTVALEVAPSLGITCNAVLPGGVDTPMMRHDEVYQVFAPELAAPTVEDLEERLRRFNPMPTAWIEPSDISHGVLYLVSDEARYVSGATLDIAAAFNAS
ncbi:SDR family mycofactocin-dependent oxidoreductase [Amycolatopsis sulphurea]|uniref:SDR family mycofactocin-dependent oxidoreductase n=1 Tax=Amycolatopsis sulphurea TaxID=76022 RepID=A0A2A9FJH4_9PSEU|nr:mycofactocin-coupled SDR family oxidoreductase [Amycolatopsis sulphurea]PFG50712.1 SDR family mycofactocin-dependent oxidoreductase [Amycolatopsis sulphurea]